MRGGGSTLRHLREGGGKSQNGLPAEGCVFEFTASAFPVEIKQESRCRTWVYAKVHALDRVSPPSGRGRSLRGRLWNIHAGVRCEQMLRAASSLRHHGPRPYSAAWRRLDRRICRSPGACRRG